MRLFVALHPPPATCTELAGWVEPLAGFRPTLVDPVHLTLRFIGEVPEDTLPVIETALTQVNVALFWLEIGGIGRFPPRGTANVIWAGHSRHQPFLHRLRQQVDDTLLAPGVDLDLPPLVPHITLARVREAAPGTVAEWLKRHHDAAGPAWHIDTFSLMASTRHPHGATHTELHRYPLRK